MSERRAAPRRSALNVAIASVSLLALVGMLIMLSARPGPWYERSYNPQTLTAVRAIAKQEPYARIFADVRYSDWLLWHDPALVGRLAYDTRFELLSAQQLREIAGLGEIIPPHESSVLAPFNVLVLDRSNVYTKLLLSRPGVHVASKNSDAVIALAGS